MGDPIAAHKRHLKFHKMHNQRFIALLKQTVKKGTGIHLRNNGERFYVFRIIWRSFQSHTDLRLSLPTSPHVAWDGKNLQCLQASSSKGHTGPTPGDPEVSHLEPGLQPFPHPPDMFQDQVSAHPQGSLI